MARNYWPKTLQSMPPSSLGEVRYRGGTPLGTEEVRLEARVIMTCYCVMGALLVLCGLLMTHTSPFCGGRLVLDDDDHDGRGNDDVDDDDDDDDDDDVNGGDHDVG